MKTIRIATCVLLLLAFPPCLGAGQKESAEEPALTWRDAETKRVLFTTHDIISFDWEKQVFLLKRDATLDFLAWVPPHMHQARKLFVEDTTGPIYEAHWVSRISSMSFPGPIYEPLSPNPYFSITKGYPRRRDPTVEDEDPRFAPRIKAGLEKAGKLCAIDLNAECVEPTIQMTGQPWSEVGEDMLVRVGYFENGFRLGEMARAHIFFAGGEKTRKQFDSLTFKITFVANERTFRSNTTIEGVPVAEIEDGIYVCTFSPWEPVEDFDRKAEPGTGVITLTVLLQRQGKTVYRLDFPESRVPVRRATKTAQQDRPESE